MSRAAILAAIRAAGVAPVPHPGEFAGAMRVDDPLARFVAAVEAAGGRAACVGPSGLAAALSATEGWRDAPRVAAAGVELPDTLTCKRFDLTAARRPHDVEGLDVLVAAGRLAVAENGAVWVATDDPPLRAALVLTRHLVLVVPAAAIVATLHEAYRRIDLRAAHYGAFIAGPSKTGDIEQSLVIGAHGPLSHAVLLT